MLITTANPLTNGENVLIVISPKECTNGRCRHEKVLHILSHCENSNPNPNEIVPNGNQKNKIQDKKIRDVNKESKNWKN